MEGDLMYVRLVVVAAAVCFALASCLENDSVVVIPAETLAARAMWLSAPRDLRD